METMEIIDAESQMMVLRDTLVEGREEPYDEVEDLNNSLKDALQDGAVKPKLHCLMMDPAFSMVTVQNEDSGIVWETASSRCSTPWASEMNATPAPEPSCAFTSPGTAGNIVVVMDEELMSRREKRKPRPVKTKALPHTGGDDDDDEIMRPAMVEVSLPNVPQAEDEMVNGKEEKHQRLFSLLSEGSEILNIIAPPKVSTVDEEASKRLEDCLFYLEETPAVKSPQMFPDEPVDEAETGEADVVTSLISEPYVTPFKESRRGTTSDDYFEKFTLLDNQAPSGEAQTAETAHQETEDSTEHTQDKDNTALAPGLSCFSSAVSMLDISGEHLDDVFYGGGRSEPHSPDDTARVREETRDLSKSSLKKSGSALFGSEESVLTPIYLPEGPPKIIDPNLLEEPKAMAFLYSDLYADAVGSRKKQDDDAESLTSEKSFHSQESDSEDRGYLEKFVLKVETLGCDLDPDLGCEERQDSFRLAGYMEQPKTQVEMKPEKMEEITDFFRNSASSSPCESVDLYQPEPEEEPKVARTKRVSVKDKVAKKETESRGGSNSPPFMDDIDFEEAFLPVEISEDCPAWEENLQTFSETTKKSTRTDKPKSKSESFREPPKSTQIINTVKPIVPCYKPFLDLSPLLPAESEDEEQQTDGVKKQDDKSVNGSEETRTSEAKEETSETPDDDVREHSCEDVTAVDPPDVQDNTEDHNETVDAPAALNKSKCSLV